MATVWPLRSCFLVILLIGAHHIYGKRTEVKGDTSGLDSQKANEVHSAVSKLLEHKIGKKLKEAANEVKHAVDTALGKHLNNAHHILSHKDADVIVMDPKLSKLVKGAVKEGKKQHKAKKAKSKASHDFPPPVAHHSAYHARRPMGHQPYGGNRFGQGYGANRYGQGYGAQQQYPQMHGQYPQRPGQMPNPQMPSQYPSPHGYPANQGYQGSPGYPGNSGYQATTASPGFPAAQGYPGYPAAQGYPSQMPGAPGQPCGASGGCAPGYGAQQSPFMPNGCPQSCNQNCYLLCPRKCCSDKRGSVAEHKKSKVHHGKHSKKRARIHRKKGKKTHKEH